MSLAKVAQGDFSRAFVNQVEKGRANPSIRVLKDPVDITQYGARGANGVIIIKTKSAIP